MTLIEKLEDLLKQATEERSHYYVASVVQEAITEIQRLDYLHKLDHSLADQWQKKNEELQVRAQKIPDLSQTVDVTEALQKMKQEVEAFAVAHIGGHDWYCGCDHWNGPNLEHCAQCGRSPSEGITRR